ncbi:MAG: signal peptidase II [Anaerolineae bacterium]|nr:signal peptidase II [Candidatus Roseilinea sp.]MDW8450337.1 signal peptidase II [Anaerolineae bacterium]
MSEDAHIAESNPPAEGSGQPAVTTFFQRYGLLLLVAGITLLADIITKRIVEAQIPLYTSIPFIGPYLSWTHTQNTGAAFSLFQNGGVFFIVVAIVVSAVILYYAPRLPAGDWLSRVALGLQLGGAVGNLLDRLRQGYVTDFIHFQIPEIGFDWPVFNIADSAIVVGVILLIAASLLRDHKA